MARLNRFQCIGYLGQDPDTRFTPDGTPVVNVSLATTERWKDKNTGAPKERTEWHRLVFFGRRAEIVQQFLKKGSLIYAEGSQRTREWTDKDNIKRYTTETVVNVDMQMLDRQETNVQPEPSAISQYELAGGAPLPSDYLDNVPEPEPVDAQ